MAVVRDYIVAEGLAKGARIIVVDDAWRGVSAEELARRRLEIARTIQRIDFNQQIREAQKHEEMAQGMQDHGAAGAGDHRRNGAGQLRAEGAVR